MLGVTLGAGVDETDGETAVQLVTAPIIPVAPTNAAHLVDPPNWNKYNPLPCAGVHVLVKALSVYN
jgi:hypothetical protein